MGPDSNAQGNKRNDVYTVVDEQPTPGMVGIYNHSQRQYHPERQCDSRRATATSLH